MKRIENGLAMAAVVAFGVGMTLLTDGVPAQTTTHAAAPAQTYPMHRATVRLVAMPEAAAEGQSNADTRVKDDLFAGTEVFAKGATNITEITMDPDSLNLVGGRDRHDAQNMVLNVVRTYQYDKPGMYNASEVETFRNKLNTGDWRCAVHTRNLKSGESTDVCNRKRTDDLKETAIITVEPQQLTFIHTIRRPRPGHSELSGLPMMLGPLHGLPSIAMLDPEVLADLGELGGIPGALGPLGAGPLPGLNPREFRFNQRKFSSLEEQQKFRDEMKKFNSPEAQQKFREEMKKFNSPENREKFRDELEQELKKDDLTPDSH
ncbi:MAG TPA: hypothetical protein VM865_02695 [Acidobacteriaceae bacterium]|nr:hypothetical protein [Acidobacteriaceae bacterium]